jgi:hypothetical protein
MSSESWSAGAARLRSERAPHWLQKRFENGKGAPQLAQGSARAAPQFMHCWLSGGFDAPQVRQSMGTAGNALIDGPKPTPPTTVPASRMCGAARLHDDAVRVYSEAIKKYRLSTNLTDT